MFLWMTVQGFKGDGAWTGQSVSPLKVLARNLLGGRRRSKGDELQVGISMRSTSPHRAYEVPPREMLWQCWFSCCDVVPSARWYGTLAASYHLSQNCFGHISFSISGMQRNNVAAKKLILPEARVARNYCMEITQSPVRPMAPKIIPRQFL